MDPIAGTLLLVVAIVNVAAVADRVWIEAVRKVTSVAVVCYGHNIAKPGPCAAKIQHPCASRERCTLGASSELLLETGLSARWHLFTFITVRLYDIDISKKYISEIVPPPYLHRYPFGGYQNIKYTSLHHLCESPSTRNVWFQG